MAAPPEPHAQVAQRVLRPRVLVYTGVLVLICAALATSLWLRTPFKVDVVRDRGTLARLVDDGRIENVYRLQMMNATERVQHYRIRSSGLPEMRVGPASRRRRRPGAGALGAGGRARAARRWPMRPGPASTPSISSSSGSQTPPATRRARRPRSQPSWCRAETATLPSKEPRT